MSRLMETILTGTREPTDEERQKGTEIVFIRENENRVYEIYACTCYESWAQWGQPVEILGDNVDTVEYWRRGFDNVEK